MRNQSDRLQKIWHSYEARNKHRPASARQAVEWAVRDGLLTPPEVDPLEVLAAQMAHALREEYQTDAQGRRYRVNHALRITKAGVQYTLWANLCHAPYAHMVRAFAQRREQIVSDCVQLKTDADVYNEIARGANEPIQIVLDFRADVAERQSVQRPVSSSELGRLA